MSSTVILDIRGYSVLLCRLTTDPGQLKLRPYQQQCPSNIVERYTLNGSFDNVECCFDIVAGVDGALDSSAGGEMSTCNAKEQCCFVGRIMVGLASHQPCVTYSVWLNNLKREPRLRFSTGMTCFILPDFSQLTRFSDK